VPRYLKAADVVVLPNSRNSRQKRFSIYSRYDTSPIKLFEYLASGAPIVASDLPSIREIVSEEEVFFVKPDDPQELAQGIERLLTDQEFARTLSSRALERSKEYTWEKRAKKIVEFINRRR